ncbi:hypothetical protein NHL50_09540 [Acidimicrobiia bacterium EGI L10123]|uniref:hypothetical protein n=1 Tax=Salinilacustrithrix flava TaxID=2957203 RepID=UPI003D7C23EA|nr:hypothetical protein [Acidimicrobiia bacterium EGI L10123]
MRSQLRRLARAIRAEPLRSIVIVVVLVDVALLLVHPLYSASASGLRGDLRLRLDKDRGFAELFGALQLVVAAILLVERWVRRRSWVALGWAIALVALVLDDLFEGHEEFGRQFDLFDAALGAVDAKRAREVVAMAVLGIVLLAVVAITHHASGRPERAWSLTMAGAASLLLTAAVGLDVVHDEASAGTWLSGLLTIAEDGGELLAMTALSVTALAWARSTT